MQPFTYRRAYEDDEAVKIAGMHAADGAAFLAGGTTLLDLAKIEVLTPGAIIDITPLAQRFGSIAEEKDGLRLGALAKMSAAARHPLVARDYPVIAQSLLLAASPQLRNMATLGGNVLQRTRCPYFRDVSWQACNKRVPGSGCAALQGVNRDHAILGTSEHCIAAYPGDFAQALVALGATVSITGPRGARTIEFEALHREPADRPQAETNLAQDELITSFFVPAGPWTRRSRFVKVRDRESFEFALASAAVALDLRDGVVVEARVALGGVATKPWRSREAERALRDKPLNERTASAAASAAFAGARTHGGDDFKVELGRRTLVRALLETAR